MAWRSVLFIKLNNVPMVHVLMSAYSASINIMFGGKPVSCFGIKCGVSALIVSSALIGGIAARQISVNNSIGGDVVAVAAYVA